MTRMQSPKSSSSPTATASGEFISRKNIQNSKIEDETEKINNVRRSEQHRGYLDRQRHDQRQPSSCRSDGDDDPDEDLYDDEAGSFTDDGDDTSQSFTVTSSLGGTEITDVSQAYYGYEDEVVDNDETFDGDNSDDDDDDDGDGYTDIYNYIIGGADDDEYDDDDDDRSHNDEYEGSLSEMESEDEISIGGQTSTSEPSTLVSGPDFDNDDDEEEDGDDEDDDDETDDRSCYEATDSFKNHVTIPVVPLTTNTIKQKETSPVNESKSDIATYKHEKADDDWTLLANASFNSFLKMIKSGEVKSMRPIQNGKVLNDSYNVDTFIQKVEGAKNSRLGHEKESARRGWRKRFFQVLSRTKAEKMIPGKEDFRDEKEAKASHRAPKTKSKPAVKASASPWTTVPPNESTTVQVRAVKAEESSNNINAALKSNITMERKQDVADVVDVTDIKQTSDATTHVADFQTGIERKNATSSSADDMVVSAEDRNAYLESPKRVERSASFTLAEFLLMQALNISPGLMEETTHESTFSQKPSKEVVPVDTTQQPNDEKSVNAGDVSDPESLCKPINPTPLAKGHNEKTEKTTMKRELHVLEKRDVCYPQKHHTSDHTNAQLGRFFAEPSEKPAESKKRWKLVQFVARSRDKEALGAGTSASRPGSAKREATRLASNPDTEARTSEKQATDSRRPEGTPPMTHEATKSPNANFKSLEQNGDCVRDEAMASIQGTASKIILQTETNGKLNLQTLPGKDFGKSSQDHPQHIDMIEHNPESPKEVTGKPSSSTQAVESKYWGSFLESFSPLGCTDPSYSETIKETFSEPEELQTTKESSSEPREPPVERRANTSDDDREDELTYLGIEASEDTHVRKNVTRSYTEPLRDAESRSRMTPVRRGKKTSRRVSSTKPVKPQNGDMITRILPTSKAEAASSSTVKKNLMKFGGRRKKNRAASSSSTTGTTTLRNRIPKRRPADKIDTPMLFQMPNRDGDDKKVFYTVEVGRDLP